MSIRTLARTRRLEFPLLAVAVFLLLAGGLMPVAAGAPGGYLAVPRTGSGSANPVASGPGSAAAHPEVAPPYIARTLDLVNGSAAPGNVNITSVGNPGSLLYDPASTSIEIASNTILNEGNVFETYQSGQVVSYDPATRALTAARPCALGAGSLAYDARSGELLLSDGFSATVCTLNATTDLVTGTVSLPESVSALAVDPGTGDVFATETQWNGTLALSPSLSVLANISVGANPAAVAFDPVSNEIYVANYGSNNLTVLNATTGGHVANVATGAGPGALAVNDTSGAVYVAEGLCGCVQSFAPSNHSATGRVTGLSAPFSLCWVPTTGALLAGESNGTTAIALLSTGASLQRVGTATLPAFPVSLAYDASTDQVYVDEFGPSDLTVLSDRGVPLGTQPIGADPAGVVFLTGSGTGYVTDPSRSNVTGFDEATGRVTQTISGVPGAFGVAYDPARGSLFVADSAAQNLSEIVPASGQIVRNIAVAPQPSLLAYGAAQGTLYVTDNLTNLSWVNATTGYDAPPSPYASYAISLGVNPVTGLVFTGEGLGFSNNGGATWLGGVEAWNPTTHRLLRTITTGEYPDGIAVDTQNGQTWTSNLGSANATVLSDSSSPQVVATVPMPHANSTPTAIVYDPMDDSMFIADPAYGAVYVVNVSTRTVTTTLWTGGAPSALAVDPSTGTVAVADPAQGTVKLIDVPAPTRHYTVLFLETGVPVGTGWKVSVERFGTFTSGSSVINFSATNGSYYWSAGQQPGLVPNPANGIITVRGANLTVVVDYANYLAGVSFDAIGLPSGTNWSVTVNGTLLAGNGGTLSTTLANGTYDWNLTPLPCYSVNATRGTLTVSGAPVVVRLGFSGGECAIVVRALGLPTNLTWTLELASNPIPLVGDAVYVRAAPRGMYAFQVSAPAGYTATPDSGSIVLSGSANATVTITFSAIGPPGAARVAAVPLGPLGELLLGAIIVAVAVLAAVFVLRRREAPVPEVAAAAYVSEAAAEPEEPEDPETDEDGDESLDAEDDLEPDESA
jgi:YVTN family beta-propeller protein